MGILATALEFGTAPSGKVLQVVYVQKTDTTTVTGTSGAPNYTNILSGSITPSSASNKVLILSRLHAGGPASNHTYVRVRRGNTDLTLADTAGNRQRVHSSTGFSQSWHAHDQVINMLDSPNTTSSTTYNVVLGTEGTSYANRTSRDDDFDYDHRGTSDLILMEIAG